MPAPPFKLPSELERIPPGLLKALLPDVAVSINQSECTCNRANFQITLAPGLFMPAGDHVTIPWYVIDVINDEPLLVGNGEVQIPSTGGSAIVSCQFEMPADAKWTPDFANQITAAVIPKFPIRNTANNHATFWGTCVG